MQLYVYDGEVEMTNNRMARMQGLDADILQPLQAMIMEINPYVKVYRQAMGRLNADPVANLQLVLLDNSVGVGGLFL